MGPEQQLHDDELVDELSEQLMGSVTTAFPPSGERAGVAPEDDLVEELVQQMDEAAFPPSGDKSGVSGGE